MEPLYYVHFVYILQELYPHIYPHSTWYLVIWRRYLTQEIFPILLFKAMQNKLGPTNTCASQALFSNTMHPPPTQACPPQNILYATMCHRNFEYHGDPITCHCLSPHPKCTPISGCSPRTWMEHSSKRLHQPMATAGRNVACISFHWIRLFSVF